MTCQIVFAQGQFLKHHREILVRKGYRQENEYQLDPPHPTLRDLSVVFDVICQQHPRYTLYVVRRLPKQSGRNRKLNRLVILGSRIAELLDVQLPDSRLIGVAG